MKTLKALKLPVIARCLLGASFLSNGACATSRIEPGTEAKSPAPIAWAELGARAAAQYQGDGLSIVRTEGGALLRCVFQRLEGEATRKGLWLTSTLNDGASDGFRIVAVAAGRPPSSVSSDIGVAMIPNENQAPLGAASTTEPTAGLPHMPLLTELEAVWERADYKDGAPNGATAPHVSDARLLPRTGEISVDGQTVRFIRSGVVEEYTVSMDGVRQDFVITEKPAGAGELRLELEVAGAQVETTTQGARLVLEHSGRKIAYGRLQVQDAQRRELSARMEVALSRRDDRQAGGQHGLPALPTDTARSASGPYLLAILVDDTDAVYPVRIDPTFSDDNWISLSSSIPGADAVVFAAAADDLGNLYIGGEFKVVGGVIANGIARWNGSSWSTLGSGMEDTGAAGGTYPRVSALAVSGTDLYAGGYFTTAGGKVSANVAKAVVDPPVLAIEPDDWGGCFIRFSGVPGTAYRLQRATALAGPWDSSAPQTASKNGVIEFYDLFPPPAQAFYRAVEP